MAKIGHWSIQHQATLAYTGSPRVTTVPTYDVSRLRTGMDEKRILSVQSNLKQHCKKVERPTPFTLAASIATEPLRLSQLPLLLQLLHHLSDIYFNSCGKELFSLFLTKYFFLFVTFYYSTILYRSV